jgi:hypothetical protein
MNPEVHANSPLSVLAQMRGSFYIPINQGATSMTNRNDGSRKRNQNAARHQLSQEEKWESLERSFNKDFIEKVKKQKDGAERLQMA